MTIHIKNNAAMKGGRKITLILSVIGLTLYCISAVIYAQTLIPAPDNQTPPSIARVCRGNGSSESNCSKSKENNAVATKACVQRTNELRATKGLLPYTESDELANNAAIGITYDFTHEGVHAHAALTNVGENMWATSEEGEAAKLARIAVEFWWSEGPENGDGKEHGHYENLVDTYKYAGCAVGKAGEWNNVYMDLK